jgi:hypothetical protein
MSRPRKEIFDCIHEIYHAFEREGMYISASSKLLTNIKSLYSYLTFKRALNLLGAKLVTRKVNILTNTHSMSSSRVTRHYYHLVIDPKLTLWKAKQRADELPLASYTELSTRIRAPRLMKKTKTEREKIEDIKKHLHDRRKKEAHDMQKSEPAGLFHNRPMQTKQEIFASVRELFPVTNYRYRISLITLSKALRLVGARPIQMEDGWYWMYPSEQILEFVEELTRDKLPVPEVEIFKECRRHNYLWIPEVVVFSIKDREMHRMVWPQDNSAHMKWCWYNGRAGASYPRTTPEVIYMPIEPPVRVRKPEGTDIVGDFLRDILGEELKVDHKIIHRAAADVGILPLQLRQKNSYAIGPGQQVVGERWGVKNKFAYWHITYKD